MSESQQKMILDKYYRSALINLFLIDFEGSPNEGTGVKLLLDLHPKLKEDDYIKEAIKQRYDNNYKWFYKEFDKLTNEGGYEKFTSKTDKRISTVELEKIVNEMI